MAVRRRRKKMKECGCKKKESKNLPQHLSAEGGFAVPY